MKKYRVRTYSSSIEILDIERETDKTIFLKKIDGTVDGYRKVTTDSLCLDSYSDAKLYLITSRINKIKGLEKKICDYEREIEKIKMMEENK